MKKSRFTEIQIVSILGKYENGMNFSEICKEFDITEQTFYNWKAEYGGISVNELKRVRSLKKKTQD